MKPKEIERGSEPPNFVDFPRFLRHRQLTAGPRIEFESHAFGDVTVRALSSPFRVCFRCKFYAESVNSYRNAPSPIGRRFYFVGEVMRSMRVRRSGTWFAVVAHVVALALVGTLAVAVPTEAHADTGGQYTFENPPVADLGLEVGGYNEAGPVAWSTTPKLVVNAYDDATTGDFASPDAPDYTFHVEVWPVDEGAAMLSTMELSGQRTDDSFPEWSTASGTVPSDVMQVDGQYRLRVETVWPDALAGIASSSGWSDWVTISVILPPEQPRLVSPEDGAVIGQTPTFVASTAQPDLVHWALVAIVTVDTDLPVRSDWVPVAADGQIIYKPQGLAGTYRWHVYVQSDTGVSEWSAERTVTVQAVPQRIDWAQAWQVRRGVAVMWAGAVASASTPVLDYTITAQPGNHTLTVPADAGPSATLTPLPEGTYTVTVTARNIVGSSLASAPMRVTVNPSYATAPQALTVALDRNDATLSWLPPPTMVGVRYSTTQSASAAMTLTHTTRSTRRT
ncbi:hypothetical protein [Leifsonia poae]|uniref:hypothetical protein n=1 Tax=Leifsonia poae TaxID=110933 RepID=UPI003D67D929